MIAIDIECGKGHVFEGWFDNLKAFEEQNVKNLISCPFCEDTNVRRVLSPVAVKKSNTDNPPASEPIDYERLAKEVVDYIQKNFEDVGPRFAAEALKMHYGVTEKKSIRGSASEEEEKTLKEEGIEYFKIPTPKIPDDDKGN
jgi:hypothetical protein